MSEWLGEMCMNREEKKGGGREREDVGRTLKLDSTWRVGERGREGDV